jgi:hypothetical protein
MPWNRAETRGATCAPHGRGIEDVANLRGGFLHFKLLCNRPPGNIR